MHVFDKFLHSINIVFFQNQLLGINVFWISRRKLQKSKIRLSLNIITILLFGLFTTYNLYLTAYFSEDALLYKSTDVLFLLNSSTYIVAVWLHGIFNSDYFSELLTAMIKFDRNLLLLGHSINYEIQRKNDVVQTVIRHSCTIFVVTYRLALRNAGYAVLFEAMMLVLKMQTCHQIVQLVTIIRVRLEILTSYLRELVAKGNNKRLKTNRRFTILCKICDMHHSIIKITRLFNRTFGVILLLTFGLSFVKIVICFFYISASLQAVQIDWTYGSLALAFSIPFISDTIYICNVCYKTVEQAGLIGELVRKIESEDQDIIEEVEMFSLQIINAPIRFSAAQFFLVDRTLIFTIIGGITTYIIILIQLSSTLLEKDG